MSDFAIITDTSSDLTSELRARFGIDDILPGTLVFPDGHSEYSDLDWKVFTPEWYFGSMKDKQHLFSTSLPNVFEVSEVFTKYLEEGRDILCINLSTGLSGTYSSCCKAAEELMEKYPGRSIKCVDTLKYSGGVGLLCITASELRAEGKSLDETFETLEKKKLTLHQMGPMDDLFFCSRMGRISNTTAIMGTLVGIKPMADFNRQGLSQIVGKARGYKNMYRALTEYVKATIKDPSGQTIVITHSIKPKEAEIARSMIQEELAPKEIIVTTIGPSCGATIGPGLVAVFYYGEEISEDLSKEKAIFESVTRK